MKKPKDNFYDKSKPYQIMKNLLKDKLNEKEIEEIFDKAKNNLSSLADQYSDKPKGEKVHLYKTILPRVAMYRALREKLSLEETISVFDETVKIGCTEVGEKLHKMTSYPLMKTTFMRLFGYMIKNMFGEKAGFKQKFYKRSSKALYVDILECPYCKASKETDSMPIAHTYCDSDVYCYGNLSGIEFIRTETLIKGGEKCDFRFSRKKNKSTNR